MDKLKAVARKGEGSDLLLAAATKTPTLLANPEFRKIITEPFNNNVLFMRELVMLDKTAFHLASENLKTDQDFILHTCTNHPSIITDPEFKKHITESPIATRSGKPLTHSQDWHFMQQLVKINPEASKLVDSSIKLFFPTITKK